MNDFAGWRLILRQQTERAAPSSVPDHPAPPVTPTEEYEPRSDRRHAFWAGGEEFVVGKNRPIALQAVVEKPVSGAWEDLDIDNTPYFRDFYPVGSYNMDNGATAEARLDSNGILHCVITFVLYSNTNDYGEGTVTRWLHNVCYYTFNTNTELWESEELVTSFYRYTWVAGVMNCDPHPAISLDSTGTPFIVIAWSEQMWHGNSYVYVFKRTGVNTWSQETAITKANGTAEAPLTNVYYLPLRRVEIDHDADDNLHIMAHTEIYWTGALVWPGDKPYVYDRIYYNKRSSAGAYAGQTFITLLYWEGDVAEQQPTAVLKYGINDGWCSDDGTYHNVHVLNARIPTGGDAQAYIVHRYIDSYGNWNVQETVLSPGFVATYVGDSSIALVPYGSSFKIRLIYHLAAADGVWHRYYTEKIGAIGSWSTPIDLGSGSYSTYLYKGSVDWTEGNQLDLCMWNPSVPAAGFQGVQYVSQYPTS